MIKDSLILKKIEELENANDVDFATIKEEDIKHCIVGVFYNPQAEYKNWTNGVQIQFVQKHMTFFTVIFPEIFKGYRDKNLNQLISFLKGKKVRLYKGIFKLPFFDFSAYLPTEKKINLKLE